MDDFQPKLIYLARRHPSLSRAEFRERWRQHGRLGMTLPRWTNIARYVHCDVETIEGPNGHRFSNHDAIGMIWHKSPENRTRHLADTSSRSTMEVDEAETFSGPIAESCLVAREEVIRTPAMDAQWKLMRFTNDPGTKEIADVALAYVRNHALPPENGKGWGLPWALVEEFSFANREDALDAACPLAGECLLALCREVQLYP